MSKDFLIPGWDQKWMEGVKSYDQEYCRKNTIKEGSAHGMFWLKWLEDAAAISVAR